MIEWGFKPWCVCFDSWIMSLLPIQNDKHSFKSTKKIEWCLPSVPRGSCHCQSPVSLPRDVCLCRYTRTLYVFVLFLPPSQLVFAVDLVVLHLTGRLFLLGAYVDVSLFFFNGWLVFHYILDYRTVMFLLMLQTVLESVTLHTPPFARGFSASTPLPLGAGHLLVVAGAAWAV